MFYRPELSLECAEFFKQGTCAEHGLMVKNILKQSCGNLESDLIPSSLPTHLKQGGYPAYSHAAACIQTKNAFILFEPAFFINDPIIVSKNGELTTVNSPAFKPNFATYYYDILNNKICVSSNSIPSFEYECQIVTNPEKAISLPVAFNNKRIPFVKYQNGEKKGRLSIRLDNPLMDNSIILEGFSNGRRIEEKFIFFPNNLDTKNLVEWLQSNQISESLEENLRSISFQK